MIRKACVAGLAGLVLAVLVQVGPAQAQGAQAGAVVFTAGADVSEPIWAPVAPGCPANNDLPVVCDGGDRDYVFDTESPGLQGQRFCAGVTAGTAGNGVGVRVNGSDVVDVPGNAPEACRVASSGEVHPVPHGATEATDPDIGGWCGLSSGHGGVTGNISTVPLPAGMEVVWLTSAGTVLPLLVSVTDPDLENPGDPSHPERKLVGAGAVQTTGATPGTCGVVPPGVGTTHFAVTGFAALAMVDAD